MWHVSLADAALTSPASWPAKRRALADRVALDLLAGRGEGDDIWTVGASVLHLRRRLSASEIDLLPPGWMAIPAIDMG